ncbi:ABC transporter substrate-binding protein [Herbivorax sp. ANBcel31]|uniref:ABC transporter substrate-binding protein n=1 Tax=Herbivorax sp. ANBcel31 TaxID=3069754 RepID=UPI0027B7BFB0|nr:ABC transporter substrate-binding protein [Herbivorax sp. ANBcel31]MDQ2085482.1 ABC transporter substrate-binding protein [Herbivorax sp. ANBcel31]
MNKQYIKKGVAVILSAIMTASLLVGCGGEDTPPEPADPTPVEDENGDVGDDVGDDDKELSGELTFMHFNPNEGPALAEAFEAKHPGVSVEVEIVTDEEDAYLNAITQDIRSGGNVPDVFAAEVAFVKRLVNLEGGYEDLSQPPYNADQLDDKLLPYTLEVGTCDDGKIRALSHQGTPGAIGYKRTLAREHLGTDDPDEISEMFSSKEKILETAETLGQAGVNIFPAWDELMRIYLGSRDQGWVVDNKLVIDDKVHEMIDIAKELRDSGYDGEMRAWSSQWTAAIEDEENFAWAIPTWGLRWIIISSMEDELDNPMASAGEWGLAHAATPFSWGGTWIGMSQDSEDKELAWEFIKFLTLDEEQAEAHARESGDFTSNIAVIEKLANDDEFEHELIGQNPYAFYEPMIDEISGDIITEYDGTIEDAFTSAMDSFLEGSLTRDEMIDQFKRDVREAFHDLEVD